MPWTAQSFIRKHNHSLTPHQGRVAAEVANAVLRATGNEGRAVRAGNTAAKHVKPKKAGLKTDNM